MKALVFGSLNIDHVYEVEHFVQPGETLASERLQFFCGGKGLNQSIALSRASVPVWMAGAVGSQDADMLLQCLDEAGVHTELILRKEIASGHAIIQKTPDGENGILLYGGANQMITEADADTVLSHFSAGDYLLLQNEINQMSYIMEKAHEMGMKIVLNPSPMDEQIFTLPLDFVDYLILNEGEGAAMASRFRTPEDEGGSQPGGRERAADKGQSSADDGQLAAGDGQSSADDGQLAADGILARLTARFPDTHIIMTLGSRGSVYRYRDQMYMQAAYPAKAVDTTGAGDTFTGYLIGSRMRGKSMEEAMDLAAKAAAIAVGRPGASASVPALEEVEVE